MISLKLEHLLELSGKVLHGVQQKGEFHMFQFHNLT